MGEVAEYLAGLKADGYLYINEKRRDYQYRVYDKSRDHLLLVASLVERLGYSAYIYARRDGRWFELVVYGREFVEMIDRLWKELLEKPTVAFARGLADAEASVIKGNPNRIRFTNRDKRVADAFAAVLNSLSIPHRRYVEQSKRGVDYIVVITGVDNIALYAGAVGFLHPEKKETAPRVLGDRNPPLSLLTLILARAGVHGGRA